MGNDTRELLMEGRVSKLEGMTEAIGRIEQEQKNHSEADVTRFFGLQQELGAMKVQQAVSQAKLAIYVGVACFLASSLVALAVEYVRK